MVFDQEFRVHSVKLKMGSKFFRKFMDSLVSQYTSIFVLLADCQ
jgi:hypothetical protein